MEFFHKKTSYPFMATRKRWYMVSAVLILVSLGSLAVRGLNFGIDFTGGVVMEFAFPQAANLEKVRGELEQAGFGDAAVQSFGTANDVLVRLLPKGKQDVNLIGQQVLAAIQASDPGVELRRTEVVGPQVGQELAEKGAMAVLFTFLLILAYVAIRFQWKLGVGAIVAALHDPIIILGFFSVTGMVFDLPALAAILAVIGYSLNDTVVVFDRLRERFLSMRKGTPGAGDRHCDQRDALAHDHDQLHDHDHGAGAAVLRRRDPARVLDGADDRHRGRHLLVHLRRERDGAGPEADRPRPDAGAAREGRS